MNHPYASLTYARSLSHWGDVLDVPEWRGHVIVRDIDGRLCDASGPYPLTILPQDADLQGGLDRLRATGLVTVVLVLDDFHRPDVAALERAFDFVQPFKTHYVLDRRLSAYSFTKHHRAMIRRALRDVQVRPIPSRDYGREWLPLYRNLVVRHRLTGLHDFPAAHFEALAEMPGVTALGAYSRDELVSAHLWIEAGGKVHSHLAASSAEGMRVGAAYAVNDAAVTFFTDAEIINFGGSAGGSDLKEDGLAFFKRGFSNAATPSFLCGKVLDNAAYERLTSGRSTARFFPAYRGAPDLTEGAAS